MTTNKSKRISIDVGGAEHRSPIPAASRIGNFMMTGHIYGRDPSNNEIVAGAENQIKLIFSNLRAILTQGGATPEDVLKLEFKVTSLDLRPAINKEWSAMFPDPASRPARHVEPSGNIAKPAEVSCEAFIVIS